MIEKLKQTPRFLKLNLQHFADTGVSGIAIGVSNFYYAPILKDTENEWETGAGTRIRFLKEIEVDRPQDTEEDYGDDMVAATAVSNGKLSVKTTFVTVPADDKAFLNGAKKGVGGYKYGAKDIPPDVAIVFERRNHDESSEWVGLFKGKFTRSSIKGQTKQDKVEFQNDDVEGNFIDRLFDESSHVTGYDKKGSTTGRDYVFMETFGKTYDEFMSSRGEQNMEPVEKEMKKTEKVEVTSVNVTDEQVTVKVDATKQLSATTEPSGQKVTYAVTEGQTYASVSPTGLVKGLAEGNATVTATAGKQTDTVQVTVQSNLEM